MSSFISFENVEKRYGTGEVSVQALHDASFTIEKGEICVIVGYLCGVAGKIVSGNVTYVLVFYIVDILMVVTDLVLTLRNQRLDREEERRAKA